MMPSWKDWRRFFEKVQITDQGCWNWKAAKLPNGYGLFFMQEIGMRVAHRRTYEWFKGPIPAWLEMDHLCRNRGCVNPKHLEAVTRKENLRRGISANREKTHCPNGHEFTPENTLLKTTDKGYPNRQCRICRRTKNQEARDKLRAEDPAKWKAQWRRWYASRKAKHLERKDL